MLGFVFAVALCEHRGLRLVLGWCLERGLTYGQFRRLFALGVKTSVAKFINSGKVQRTSISERWRGTKPAVKQK